MGPLDREMEATIDAYARSALPEAQKLMTIGLLVTTHPARARNLLTSPVVGQAITDAYDGIRQALERDRRGGIYFSEPGQREAFEYLCREMERVLSPKDQ